MIIIYSKSSVKALSRMDTISKLRIKEAIEQISALEFVKRLVFAWDSDFTRVTPAEAAAIKEGDNALASGVYVRHEDIDWD